MTAEIPERPPVGQQTRLADALRIAGLGTWELDLATGRMWWSDEMYPLFERPPALGPPTRDDWLALTHPDDHAQIRAAAERTVTAGTPFESEYRVPLAGGGVRWVLGRALAQRDAAGAVALVRGVVLDISERKALEEQVRRQQLLMENILNAIPDPVFVKNEDHRWIMLNDAMCQFFGLGRASLLGLTDHDYFPRHEADHFWAMDEQVFRTGQVLEVEESFTRATGERHVISTRKKCFRTDEGRQILVGTIRDVTARALNETTLRAAKDAAEAAARAKSDFLATMSHEIRTPMNGVLGMLQLLEDDALTADQRDCVETMGRSARALLTIINDVLDYSKIEAGGLVLAPAPFPLRATLEEVCELLRPQAAEKGLALRLAVDPAAPAWVFGDVGRIRQVLLNLVGNAVKFTPRGHVCLVVAPGDRGRVAFSVEDTGIGMDGATLARLFQPFTQADASTTRRYGGTGLGLAISQRLVSRMGGVIAASSAPGAGTVFSFALPLRASRPESQAPPPAAPGAWRHGVRVLLAEDNAVNQKVAVRMLERLGCVVAIAANGREAVERAAVEPVDLLLMDWHMPELDGLQATSRIRAQERPGTRLPIIAMTANAMEGDAAHCFASGMDDYLTKPVTRADLERVLARWLPAD